VTHHQFLFKTESEITLFIGGEVDDFFA
jgi:hypothetical protein